jgi:hypothetical protein
MWILRVLVLVAVGLGFCSGPSLADKRQARRLFKRAERHYRDQNFKRALSLYRAAYRASRLSGFFFNIGQCYRRLGKHQKAIEAFELYLKRTKHPKNASRAGRLIAVCRRKLKGGTSAPKLEKPPKPKKPQPGETRPTTEKPIAKAEKEDKVHVNAVAVGQRDKRTEPLKATPPRPRRGLSSGYFWTGLTAAGALVVAGTVSGVMALSKSSTYKDPTTPNGELQDLKSSGETLRTISTATFISAGVIAAGTAVVYFFTDWQRKESAAPRAAVSVSLTPTGGAMVWSQRF